MIQAIRYWFYFQLDQKQWKRKGLSPLNLLSVILIFAVVILQLIETEEELFYRYRDAFMVADWCFAAIFTLELFLRLWSYGLNPKFAGFKGRLRYLKKPRAIIDILTLIPFYITVGDLEVFWLRAFRILRILSLLKFSRFTGAFGILFSSIVDRRFELGVTFLLAVFLLLISATVMYFVEKEIQPEVFGSIPRALWWSVITLTTVGYGDVVPITVLGKMMASMTAIIGIGLVSIPAGLLAAAFSDAFQKKRALLLQKKHQQAIKKREKLAHEQSSNRGVRP